jgi:hypothetical protein
MPDPDDLWGADFHPHDVESGPVSLLRTQADVLEDHPRIFTSHSSPASR